MFCFLLLVAVLNCDPAAQGYLPAFQQVPAIHRQLITEIEVSHTHRTGRSVFGGYIRIPLGNHYGIMWHEIGHHVGWANDSRLLKAFAEKFWPEGEPKGRPSSGYAGRQGVEEDFAETYRLMIRGRTKSNRVEWMRKWTSSLS